MTYEYLIEPCLTQYYLLEAICGDFMSESERSEMFKELARLFCISDYEELDDYYTASKQKQFSDIKNLKSYERFCRNIEFAQMSNQDVGLTERDRVILAQKREAMIIKADIMSSEKNMTKENVTTALLLKARNGNIHAIAIRAYMDYHGLCVFTDKVSAIKRIRLTARWNNLFGNLMGIAYDKENERRYFNNLNTIYRHEGDRFIFEHIRGYHGYTGACELDQSVRTLETAFGIGAVTREQYDSSFSKIVYSPVILAEDKEKLVVNYKHDVVNLLGGIPLDIKRGGRVEFDITCADRVPIKRSGEAKKIFVGMAVAVSCPSAAYSPLLISCADEYITDMYAEMMKDGLKNSSVFEIDAETITMQDLVCGSDNIFLRGLAKTKNARTVFIIRNCEELDRSQMSELIKMLDYNYRKRYKLFNPPVSLDLSDFVFVLLANGESAEIQMLSEHCDTVRASRITRDEKQAVAESLFRSRAKSFGISDIEVEDGCFAHIAGYDLRQAAQIIDGVLRNAIFYKSTVIGLESVKEVCREQRVDAARRDFGYTGGGQG